jgi:hypothetical protein
LFEVVRRADETDLIEWRAVRLDGEDRLDQIGPRIRDRPAESATLGMRHHDRRTDLVEQRDQSIAVQELLLGEIRDFRQEARHHHDGGSIVRLPGARPLRMQMRLRPKLKLLLLEIAPQGAFEIADTGGTVVAPVIDHDGNF